MKRRMISFLASIAVVVFAVTAGAACYHQYLVQRGMLRTSRAVYIPPDFFPEEGQEYIYKRK